MRQPFYRFGLIGYPLGHSLSPRLHQAALQAFGLNGEYQLFPIAPQSQAEIERRLDEVRQGRLDGLNVTIPHKQTVLPWMDTLTPAARQIGAVNTIYRSEHGLTGDNTDAAGFLADLTQVMHPPATPASSALVLGAGGSARAVVYALWQSGWAVTIAARRSEQAEALVRYYLATCESGRNRLSIIRLPALEAYCRQAPSVSLIVNTTPLGMTPDVTSSPWPDDFPLPAQAFVYDLVYNPPETRWLGAARAAGLGCANGLGMLAAQAALSFERWTGLKAPVDVFKAAIGWSI